MATPSITADSAAPAARRTPVRCVFLHIRSDHYSEDRMAGKFTGPRFPPLWAYTLAAHVPQDGRFSLALHDDRDGGASAAPAADLYLFSGMNQDLQVLLAARRDIAGRQPNALCVIGGPICASFDRSGDLERLEAFDHVCVGDGEALVVELLEAVAARRQLPKVLRARERFPMAESKPLHQGLLRTTADRFYCGLVEVSRGCPFLCEFCDVRIAPDNNRMHHRSPDVIVADLDTLCRLGVRQFQLVCDNLIGDPKWAEELLDRVLEWEDRTGFRPSFYSWATVNLRSFPVLMRKMRLAGVDMLNVGVESFNRNSLLETAKIQNSPGRAGEPARERSGPCPVTIAAIQEIQSYGLLIAGGLIFGFDSDREDCFEIALEGILAAGLLSGDPHLLTALPGTPLYRRMRLAGRLRRSDYGLGFRYQTNIRYLLPRPLLIGGLMRFFRRYSSGEYQYGRLVACFEALGRGNFVPLRASRGFISFPRVAAAVLRNPAVCRDYARRALVFASDPQNLYYALKGTVFVAARRGLRGRSSALQLWLFMWINSVVKARRLSSDDFDIEDVGPLTRPEHILPPGYAETSDEPIPVAKIRAQLRYTTHQLLPLVAELPRRPADEAEAVHS